MYVKLKHLADIKAKRDLKGISNSYSTPERIDIKKGAVLKVTGTGTRFGDAFCNLSEGKATRHVRSNDERDGTLKEVNIGGTIGLSEGYETAPYSLGRINTEDWEVL